ncbi:MAG: ferrochelatase [Armatimonadota bacterium]|nr:ferrochelatase [Armatimonadota bacterium]MDW8154983.1 ferrochelatase [Armatimonadota bacterium]
MTVGVLLMAYGTPRHLDEVEDYFTHIRRGRKPSPEEVEDLRERYRRIGGASPLREITEAQARGLQAVLDRREPGRFRVYLAMKHSAPFIPEVAQAVVQDGVRHVVALVLAPHESRMIVDEYLEYAEPVFREVPGLRLRAVRSWHLNPGFLAAVERRIRSALARFPDPRADATEVLFTAHSLPERILEWADPYPRTLQESAQALADRVGLPRWRVCYQSAGHTPFRWLGPDILDVLRELAGIGHRQVLAVPVGFVADHLEVLYDLDVEAAELAAELGLVFRRTDSLNTDPEFLEGLGQEVVAAAREL